MKLAILNTSIMTSEGVFSLRDISLEEARKLAIDNRDNLLSAVGHQSTADILTTLLGVEIKMNRINSVFFISFFCYVFDFKLIIFFEVSLVLSLLLF